MSLVLFSVAAVEMFCCSISFRVLDPATTYLPLLMSSLISLITGRYDFVFLPLALPTPIVLALLSEPFSASSSASPFLTSTELHAGGLSVPDAGEGKSWVIVEAGRQINTGPLYVPGGKSNFLVRPSSHLAVPRFPDPIPYYRNARLKSPSSATPAPPLPFRSRSKPRSYSTR